MTTALIVLALAQPLVVGAFCWLIWKRDDRMWTELQVVLNRIQDPPTAVAQTMIPRELEELGPPDTEWSEMAKLQRLEDTYTEGA